MTTVTSGRKGALVHRLRLVITEGSGEAWQCEPLAVTAPGAGQLSRQEADRAMLALSSLSPLRSVQDSIPWDATTYSKGGFPASVKPLLFVCCLFLKLF